MTKFCLTGSTGALGSRVLHHLLHTLEVPPKDLIISLYNPSKAPEEAKSLGIEIRQGDYTSPESLRKSFQGVDRLFLVSFPSRGHEARVIAHVNAINAALDVGIKHVYYTSLAFGDDSKAGVKQAHLDTEAYLDKVCKASAMTYTSIKEGIYSESFPLYLNFKNWDATPSERTAFLPINPSKGVAWVTRDDLGEATARIIYDDCSSPRWRNQKVLLSGPESWTFDQLAACISKILGWEKEGHPLKVEAIGEEAWITRFTTDPESEEFWRSWATTYPAIERGETAVVDALCEELNGHPSIRMEAYLRSLFHPGGQGTESMDRYAT